MHIGLSHTKTYFGKESEKVKMTAPIDFLISKENEDFTTGLGSDIQTNLTQVLQGVSQ
jgi:hypothetical protein